MLQDKNAAATIKAFGEVLRGLAGDGAIVGGDEMGEFLPGDPAREKDNRNAFAINPGDRFAHQSSIARAGDQDIHASGGKIFDIKHLLRGVATCVAEKELDVITLAQRVFQVTDLRGTPVVGHGVLRKSHDTFAIGGGCQVRCGEKAEAE